MKKSFLLSLLILTTFIFSCNQSGSAEKENENEVTFIHTVFFWLNESVSEAEKIAFETGLEILGSVPSIEKFYYGKPAGTPREVVDNSYDYALIVHFQNAEAQDEYQEHEIHLEFIDQFQHIWEYVKVYDTILED